MADLGSAPLELPLFEVALGGLPESVLRSRAFGTAVGGGPEMTDAPLPTGPLVMGPSSFESLPLGPAVTGGSGMTAPPAPTGPFGMGFAFGPAPALGPAAALAPTGD